MKPTLEEKAFLLLGWAVAAFTLLALVCDDKEYEFKHAWRDWKILRNASKE